MIITTNTLITSISSAIHDIFLKFSTAAIIMIHKKKNRTHSHLGLDQFNSWNLKFLALDLIEKFARQSVTISCAAKIFHETLLTNQVSHHREHRIPVKRFEKECQFMSAIRHANIVQCVGTYQDPETGLSVLLMEQSGSSKSWPSSFPCPADRLKTVHTTDPQFLSGTVYLLFQKLNSDKTTSAKLMPFTTPYQLHSNVWRIIIG